MKSTFRSKKYIELVQTPYMTEHGEEMVMQDAEAALESSDKSEELLELMRSLEPIQTLLSEVGFHHSAPEVYHLSALVGGGKVKVGVTVQRDMLTLNTCVGLIPATAENYATLLAENAEGPWWFRIDDVGRDGLAVVVRVCELHRRNLARLDTLMLEAWKDYWRMQGLLEVLNGTFDQP